MLVVYGLPQTTLINIIRLAFIWQIFNNNKSRSKNTLTFLIKSILRAALLQLKKFNSIPNDPLRHEKKNYGLT